MDLLRSTTREERARRRAEEAAVRANWEMAGERSLSRGRAELPLARGGEEMARDGDSTVGVRGGLGRSRHGHGGMGGSRVGTRRMRRAGSTLDEDEVGVLEVMVAHHEDQPVEEIREEAVERVVEVGTGDVAVREMVEVDEDEADVGIGDVEELVDRAVAEAAEDEDSVVIIDQVLEADAEDRGRCGGEDWEDDVDDMVEHVDDMEEQVDDLGEHVDDIVEHVDDMEEHVDVMVDHDDDMQEQLVHIDNLVEQLGEQGEQEEDDDVEQAEDEQVEAEDDYAEGAHDVNVEAAQGVHAEVAQMGDVDDPADSPLSDTIDLTDSPPPSR